MPSPFFFLFTLFLPFHVYAEDPQETFVPVPKVPAMMQQTAEAISAGVQKQIARAADLLDVELAGQRYVTGHNPSNVNLSLLEVWEEGRRRSSTDFGLNLRLPNTEKRWALRFSSYDEDAEERNLNQRTVRTTPRPKNYGTALILFKKIGAIKTSFQPRLQFKNPLYTNYTAKFESDAHVKDFRINPMLELYADSQKGTGEYFSLTAAYRPGGGRWEYSVTSDEEYQQNRNQFNVDHGLSASYQLSDTRSIVESAIFSSNNHAYHLGAMTYSLAFNQQVYPKILSFTLAPYWAFTKQYNFKGFAGVSLDTEIVF